MGCLLCSPSLFTLNFLIVLKVELWKESNLMLENPAPFSLNFSSPMTYSSKEISSHTSPSPQPHPQTKKIPLKTSLHFPITITVCKHWSKLVTSIFLIFPLPSAPQMMESGKTTLSSQFVQLPDTPTNFHQLSTSRSTKLTKALNPTA